MDGFDMIDLRHEASRAKWRKTLFRNDPPPFLGPLVTIKEAMEALNRSQSFVYNRISDGRLNTWKDPISKRVWILKDDLDILIGDNRAPEEKGKLRIGKPRPKPQPDPEDESEDLDAIGGWEHPKPPPIIGGAAIEESIRESQARFDAKERENEEWYAAELAKLEDRDPEEAVRQLQIERGWLIPESPEEPAPEPDSVYADATPHRWPNHKEPIRPISYSNPNRRAPNTPPKSYIDPDFVTLSHHHPIIPSFPTGWVSSKEACNILQVCRVRLAQYAKEGKLQRRQRPDGKNRFLYDSLELERLAEQRLTWQAMPLPNESYSHWGPRSRKMEIGETDIWIKSSEAAHILGITRQRLFEIIREGKLPCYLKDPGKQGSPIFVPHNMVIRLRDNRDRQKNRDASLRGREATQPQDEGWEDQGIDPYQNSDSTPNTRRDWGEFYTTRQTAHALGISVGSVHCLRIRGRLTGHQHTWRKAESDRKWWFFKKEDVHNLQADPEYCRHHKRYKKQFDKLWQDDPQPEPAAQPAPPTTTGWSWDDSDLPTW